MSLISDYTEITAHMTSTEALKKQNKNKTNNKNFINMTQLAAQIWMLMFPEVKVSW